MIRLWTIKNCDDGMFVADVYFDHPYTVGEFIKDVYENRCLDYGGDAYGVVDVGTFQTWRHRRSICEYRDGKWQTPCPQEYMNRTIRSARCHYGYSRYDFDIILTKEVPEDAGE